MDELPLPLFPSKKKGEGSDHVHILYCYSLPTRERKKGRKVKDCAIPSPPFIHLSPEEGRGERGEKEKEKEGGDRGGS